MKHKLFLRLEEKNDRSTYVTCFTGHIHVCVYELDDIYLKATGSVKVEDFLTVVEKRFTVRSFKNAIF